MFMWTMDVKRYMRGNTHLVTLLSQLLLSLNHARLTHQFL